MRMSEEFLCKLEEELMVKGGRWIADFRESERNYRLGDLTFDIYLSGGTKMKGFGLFSRILSALLLPSYSVACYVIKVRSSNLVSPDFLKKLLSIIRGNAEKNHIKWSWLMLIVRDDPPSKVVKLVENHKDKEIGLLLHNPDSKLLVNSKNLLGERMRACLKLWLKKSRQ